MKNVFLFIFRNHVFFIFLFLEIVCFSLIVNNNQFHRASYFNSSNYVVGNVYTFRNSITEYFGLRKLNTELSLENAALRSILQQSKYISTDGDIQTIDSINWQQYNYVPAKVVNNSTNRRNNHLTIDKGMLQGVQPQMAVISSNGIVGIVKDVSKNYASVISILHKNSSISARLTANGYFGSLVWDGRNAQIVQLTDIPSHVKIMEGMEVETSGFSAMFPRGIPIGKVLSFNLGPGDSFYLINVKLRTNLNATGIVYVVNNLMRMEQRQLEKLTQEDAD